MGRLTRRFNKRVVQIADNLPTAKQGDTMKPRDFIHAIVLGLFAFSGLTGCSARLVPLDQPYEAVDEREEAVYDGYYFGGYGSPPPHYSYDAWHMSHYYQYAEDLHYGGYAIAPNPNDSYTEDEAPIRRAPTQDSVQPTNSNRQNSRRVGQREDNSFQRSGNRSRQTSSGERRENGRETWRRLKQRRHLPDRDTEVDEERKARREQIRRRSDRR